MKLYENIIELAWKLGIQKQKFPEDISKNLKYNFFEWQEEALSYFLTYEKINEYQEKSGAEHLMFNMATGTGKTLLMGSLILYYYKKGYRNFIFFVNQNNIVSKTENNFLDKCHNKYLFKNKIIIDNKEIKIIKVETFSDYTTENIEIKFSTVQKLYNDIHNERENGTTLDDLRTRDIIMFADEAHHLNATTKKGNLTLPYYPPEVITSQTKDEDIEKFGWEQTIVNYVLHKNNSLNKNKNVLLEFTATIPENSLVQEKYKNKIIYKFDLKDFLQKGYTKEINLISSTFSKKERILHVLLFNWYRHNIAIRNGIPNFKPVILFRSKTIEESKEDFEFFLDIVESINLKDFDFIKNIEKIAMSDSIYEQGKTRTKRVLEMLNGDFSEVVKFIKQNFLERNVIITNSKTNKTKKEKVNEDVEKLLNNLEDRDNHVRAIFTVDRLTEGWDVLNLYDIVRLYEGQNSGGGSKKIPEATVKEKQLIGRGVRYYPFCYQEKQKNKRKFDNDLNNEMRILEELFFYTYDEESRYISHLKQELKKDGFFLEDKIIKKFNLKSDFKKSSFYKNIKIIGNELKKNSKTRKMKLEDLSKTFYKEYKIFVDTIVEDSQFLGEDNQKSTYSKISEKINRFDVKIKDFEAHIFNKALNIKINSDPYFFNFEILQNKLKISSFNDLQKEEFLGNFKISIVSPYLSFDRVNNQEKLEIIVEFLTALFKELEKDFNENVGSEFKKFYKFEEIFGKEKEKVISRKNIQISEMLNSQLQKERWYALDSFVGTSEEVEVMKFISQTVEMLKNKYSEIFIIRNEEMYKIYDFKTGKGFQPDFLMFLKEKNEAIYYQIFIEAKGEHILAYDSWKEEFLLDITEKYKGKNMFKHENEKYFLLGLPFYTEEFKEKFKSEYEKLYV